MCCCCFKDDDDGVGLEGVRKKAWEVVARRESRRNFLIIFLVLCVCICLCLVVEVRVSE